MVQKFDPITLEILWRRLISIVDEADATISRTCFSSLGRDAHDYTCCFFDRKGREVCQGTFVTPGQLGAMVLGVKDIINMFPIDSYKQGDVFITNDPWLGVGHLHDVLVLSPIFYKDRLVAFASCVFHHTDIGGRRVPDNREVFEEGLFIPLVKLYDDCVLNQTILDFIQANVRKPEDNIGDVRSQVAANHVCSQKIVEMMEEYGLDTMDDLADEIIWRSEKDMRDAIQQIPDGIYSAEGIVEQVGGKPDIKIKVTLEVKGSDIITDFDGTSPQVDWSINSPSHTSYAYTHFAIKSAFNPETPNNEGSTKPISIKAPEGTIVNCKFPAAVANRTQVIHMIPEIIYRALAPVTPKRVLAGSGTTPGSFSIFYGFKHNGERFQIMILRGGGMGANYCQDGHFIAQFPANVGTTPCEIFESDAPFIVEKKEIICDSGGPGKMRGGLGQEFVVRVPSDEYSPTTVGIVTMMGRLHHSAEGLFTGKEGSRGRFQINATDKDWGRAQLCKPGDVVRYCHPGGGGYGDPLDRDPKLVESDVINGYVSLEKAREEYAVVIDPDTLKLDLEGTQKLRSSIEVVGEDEP